MRRAIASFLLAVFSLAVAASLGPPAAEAALPACCRRDGRHHCAISGEGRGPFLAPQKCAAFPAPAAAPAGAAAPAAKPASANAGLPAHLSIPLVEAPACRALLRHSVSGRAPPAPLS